MSRLPFSAAAALAVLLSPAAARAWDGPNYLYADAAGQQPGAGGLIGTGGAKDRGITCAHCHTQSQGLISVKVDFTPALPTVGGQTTYSPGQQYQVSVKLLGEHLGLSGCGQYTANVNNFAAAFEDGTGKPTGVLGSDSGQSSASCPAALPKPINGTTVLWGDCHAITSAGKPDQTSWSFTWTAPAAGTGPVRLHYGAVDGNCDMMSMNDDVRAGSMTLGEASAALTPPPAREGRVRLALLLGLVPVGLALARRRRRRRG
jgi:hypothetical protein